MFENQKPKTENRKPPLRICVPVVEATVNRARGRYQRAARKGLVGPKSAWIIWKSRPRTYKNSSGACRGR